MMTLLSAIRQNSLGLGFFAVLTAGAIALTQVATQSRIAANQEQAQARALYQILPRASIDNDLLHDTTPGHNPQLLGYSDPVAIHLGRRDGKVRSVIIPARAPDGYTGNIDLIVGIHADGRVAGVRVLRHQETPGLGDKVELKKSDWVLGFNNQRLHGDEDPTWGVKKDGGRFDQFTGATITPRAVTAAVQGAIRYFNNHRASLLATPSPAGVTRQGAAQ